MNIESHEQWDTESEIALGVVYYSIRLGHIAITIIKCIEAGMIPISFVRDFKNTSKRFELWLKNSNKTKEFDPVKCKCVSLIHLTVGLKSQMEATMDSFSNCSISPDDFKKLTEAVQWWDTGFRRCLRTLSGHQD